MRPMQRRRNTSIQISTLVAAIALVGSGLFSWVIAVDAATAAISHGPKSIVISTSQNTQYGTILVSGTALYTLKASATPCTAQCIKVWPELLLPKGTRKAKAGAGVSPAKLGTVKRVRGALQVTYAGKPLYRFAEDTAGQVNGNITDVWGKWSLVVMAKPTNASPVTTPVVTPASPTAGTSPPSSGNQPTSPPPSSPTTPAPTSPPPTSPPPTSPPPTTPPPTTTPGSGGVGF